MSRIVEAVLRPVRLASAQARAVALGLCMALLLGAILWWDLPTKEFALQEGEVSRVRINAPRQLTYTSASKTREAQERAAAAVQEVYEPPDPQIGRQQVMRAQSALNYLDSVRHDPYTTYAQKQALIATVPELALPDETLSRTIAVEDARWTLLARESLAALEQVMRGEIRPEQAADARASLRRFVSRELTTDESVLAGELVRGFVVANSLPNPERTSLLREEARHAVAPVTVTWRQDETILREGEVISPAALEALSEFGLLRAREDIRERTGKLLLAGLLSALVAAFFLIQPVALWGQWRRIVLILLLSGLAALGAKFLAPSGGIQFYLLPLPAVAMVLALVVGAPGSLVVMACLSLLATQMGGDGRELDVLLFLFVGSAIGAVTVHRVERINSFAGAGFFISLANVLVIAVLFLLRTPPPEPFEFAIRMGTGVLNAVLSVSLALAVYSLAGHYLDITTPLQLLELARPTHPLLRQLLLKAPGTYHHTLLISNMAERAAELIGADPLLARVAAYYHDIGKTVQPYFFIENQIDRDNPHDELNDPYESARIVIQHVPDGIGLAKRFGLPRPIVDVIEQHHGTMLAAYFYHRARLQSPTGEVNEALFRYPGPRPQTRESALIMLADGAEATVRATRPATLEELDEVLKKIFRDRLGSGELDESNLHLRDLGRIRQAFLEILQGQFHPRVTYPSEPHEALPEPRRGIWLESPDIPEREQ